LEKNHSSESDLFGASFKYVLFEMLEINIKMH